MYLFCFRLAEALRKYEERDARPEDLAAIAALQEAVTQRDMLLKRMETDKRFYQLELVNRETNFNKVFSADPKVGLLNPLAVGKGLYQHMLNLSSCNGMN